MTGDDVLTWTAGRLAEAVRRREIASRELLSVALDRVERINPKLNAVVTLDAERAATWAAAADEARPAARPGAAPRPSDNRQGRTRGRRRAL